MNLKKRFEKFQKEKFPSLELLYKELVEKGQSPNVMIISCSDSRVIPELITCALPGEIFVIRNIANMVPPYDSDFSSVPSAIEYAVEHLKISRLLVLGHSQCGGVKAILEGSNLSKHLNRWLKLGEELLRRLKEIKFSSSEEKQHMAEIINIQIQLERLLEYPCVKAALGKRFSLEGWYYQLAPPSLSFVDSII